MALSPTSMMLGYLGDLAKHRFSFWSVDAPKVCEDEEDISGKVVIVTGSNNGIGKEIAKQMARRGAKVIMAVRDLEKGQAALEDIRRQLTAQKAVEIDIVLMKLDLGDLQIVRDFVKEFESKYSHLNILVNNAGYMDTRGEKFTTKDGFEQHIGVNHFGPFLLTRLLIPSLQKGSPSRVVCVASSGGTIAPLDMKDLLMETKLKTGEMGKEAYNISKLYNSICIKKLAEDFVIGGNSGIKFFQICPGYVNTDLFQHEEGILKKFAKSISLTFVGLTAHQGCETAVFCAVAKSIIAGEASGRGDFYRFLKIWNKGDGILGGYASSENGQTLYKISEQAVGLREKDDNSVK